MKKILVIFLGCVLLALEPTLSFSAEQWNVDSQSSRISFSGKSTLHPFHGRAQAMDGYLQDMGKEKKEVFQGRISVDVDQLDTQNVKRDRNMKKMFRVEQYPQIVFQINSIEKVDSTNEPLFLLKGELTIAGKSQSVETNVKRQEVQGQMSVLGQFKVSLASYALRPPSVVGIIRVSDDVWVDFEVVFKHENNDRNSS